MKMDLPSEAPDKRALRRAAEVLGGQSAIASACGYKDRRNVWPWFAFPHRLVPLEHCIAIERATTAAGSPVRREELRPDIAW